MYAEVNNESKRDIDLTRCRNLRSGFFVARYAQEFAAGRFS